MIIVIDGPFGSGKTTVARDLAKLLGFKHINTGAIYRSVALLMTEKGLGIEEVDAICDIARNLDIDFCHEEEGEKFIIDKNDRTRDLFTPDINALTSRVSAIPELRESLVGLQRNLGAKGKAVFEGRDMGTVIFPNADWKFYITALVDIRARRWFKLLSEEARGQFKGLEDCQKYVEAIDERDRTREAAPLKVARDAMIYDNTLSPSSYEDALILKYYMTNTGEIIQNAALLKDRKGP